MEAIDRRVPIVEVYSDLARRPGNKVPPLREDPPLLDKVKDKLRREFILFPRAFREH